MVGNQVLVVASLAALGTFAVPAVGSAQGYGYVNDDQPSVVVECGTGQRAVMEQRRINGRTQVVARCEGARSSAARRSTGQYAERAPRRSKTKSALMIAGSAATGAGVGGAIKGKKGALIGAAIGGGSASINEAAKRR
jgi:hypothetical protein